MTGRGPMKSTSASLSLGLLLMTLSGCELFHSLDKDASYATYEEAKADGAMRRGWIPAFVPASATDLKESHNLDTNESWLTFRFAEADREGLAEALTPADAGEVQFPRGKPTRQRDWWPLTLSAPSSSARDTYDLYRCESGFAAIEKSAPVAWVWRL